MTLYTLLEAKFSRRKLHAYCVRLRLRSRPLLLLDPDRRAISLRQRELTYTATFGPYGSRRVAFDQDRDAAGRSAKGVEALAFPTPPLFSRAILFVESSPDPQRDLDAGAFNDNRDHHLK